MPIILLIFLSGILICFVIDFFLKDIKKDFIFCFSLFILLGFIDNYLSQGCPEIPQRSFFQSPNEEKINSYIGDHPELNIQYLKLKQNLQKATEIRKEKDSQLKEPDGSFGLNGLKESFNFITESLSNSVDSGYLQSKRELELFVYNVITLMAEEAKNHPRRKIRNSIRAIMIAFIIFSICCAATIILLKTGSVVKNLDLSNSTFSYLFWNVVIITIYDIYKRRKT